MADEHILDRFTELITPTRVFGEPFTRDGVTVIPAVDIRGAGGGGQGTGANAEEGGGGGFAVRARPAGVLEIRDGTVQWRVPPDVNRAILGAQVVVVAFIVFRWLGQRAKARAAVGVAQRS